MSWSVSYFGTPAAVAKELDIYEAGLSGQSHQEFSEVKPALQTLLGAYVPADTVIIQLNASGHATVTNGTKTAGYISVTMNQVYGKVLM